MIPCKFNQRVKDNHVRTRISVYFHSLSLDQWHIGLGHHNAGMEIRSKKRLGI